MSVCGTGVGSLPRSFSRQFRVTPFGTCFPSPSRLGLLPGGFASPAACSLGPGLPSPGWGYLPASLHRSNDCRRYWNFNQLSIAYASRPRLRSRLTLGGRPFPRKPWVFGGQDSHLSFRVLIPAFSLACAPTGLATRIPRPRNAPLPLAALLQVQSFGTVL